MRSIFIISFMFFLLFSCQNSLEDAKHAAGDELDLSETGLNIEMLQTEKGKPKIKITAPKTIRYPGNPPYTEFPEGMEIFVYNEKGEIENKLSAGKGKTLDNSTEVTAEEKVTITNSNGDVMITEKLVWDQKKKKLISEDSVQIFTNDEIIKGTGFEANEDFSSYTIRNISGIVKIKDDTY